MQTKAPKTVEEARALPEVGLHDWKFGPYGFDGDSIIAFIDLDGKLKEIVGTDKGYAKKAIW